MKQVEIYTKATCPYCKRAKALLESRRVAFVEYDITDDPAKAEEMRRRSGRQTVPEIFVDGELIGGCDDLLALEAQGTLDQRLGI